MISDIERERYRDMATDLNLGHRFDDIFEGGGFQVRVRLLNLLDAMLNERDRAVRRGHYA